MLNSILLPRTRTRLINFMKAFFSNRYEIFCYTVILVVSLNKPSEWCEVLVIFLLSRTKSIKNLRSCQST
jgi:hypothetical protein